MRTRGRGILLLVLTLGLVGSTACRSSEEASDQPADPRTAVEVRNRRGVSVEIYVLDGERPVRLGRVGAGSTKTFTIPSYVVARAAPIRFRMEPSSAAADVLSETIPVAPGDRVVLVVPSAR